MNGGGEIPGLDARLDASLRRLDVAPPPPRPGLERELAALLDSTAVQPAPRVTDRIRRSWLRPVAAGLLATSVFGWLGQFGPRTPPVAPVSPAFIPLTAATDVDVQSALLRAERLLAGVSARLERTRFRAELASTPLERVSRSSREATALMRVGVLCATNARTLPDAARLQRWESLAQQYSDLPIAVVAQREASRLRDG